jgi:hypothetical protein
MTTIIRCLMPERGTDARGSGGGSLGVCVLLDPPPQLEAAKQSTSSPASFNDKFMAGSRFLNKASNFDALAPR